ncbi:hypothetical protein D0U04_18190 [Bacillus clarus]|uniref:Uncharacterized protein n=1 Tax=Bacillus clarus TaxID=2338372 RepID=A0ABX9KSL4_9BACI|nr:hypothetical protein D0U04_18190 [Bacillus clarus]
MVHFSEVDYFASKLTALGAVGSADLAPILAGLGGLTARNGRDSCSWIWCTRNDLNNGSCRDYKRVG